MLKVYYHYKFINFSLSSWKSTQKVYIQDLRENFSLFVLFFFFSLFKTIGNLIMNSRGAIIGAIPKL